MGPLRQAMASFLASAAHEAMEDLDPSSPCARALETIDVERALEEDISRICQTITLGEIAAILSLAARLRTITGEEKRAVKTDLKKMAGEVAKRVEEKSGPLKLPEPCRHLLWSL